MDDVEVPVNGVTHPESGKGESRHGQRHDQPHGQCRPVMVDLLLGQCLVSVVFGHVS